MTAATTQKMEIMIARDSGKTSFSCFEHDEARKPVEGLQHLELSLSKVIARAWSAGYEVCGFLSHNCLIPLNTLVPGAESKKIEVLVAKAQSI